VPQGQNSGTSAPLLRVAFEAAPDKGLHQLRQLPQRGQVRTGPERLGRQRQPALVQGLPATLGSQGRRARVDDDVVDDGVGASEGSGVEG